MRLFRRHAIRYFLLLLFLSYYAGITLFMHAHVVNGVTVVHSHPYAPDNPQHGHSSVEFDLIHALNHFDTTASVLGVLTLTFIPLLLFVFQAKPITFRYSTPYNGLVGLRAPPLS